MKFIQTMIEYTFMLLISELKLSCVVNITDTTVFVLYYKKKKNAII